MTVYIALAVFPVFFGTFFSNLNKDKRQKICFYFMCGLAMFLVMGLRHYSLGSTDTLNYYNAMKRAIASETWAEFYNADYFEIGAQVLIFSLSRVFNDPQWLLVITSLFFIVSILYFVERNSDNIPLSITAYIALGLMQFHLQGMRQSIAMSICIFAYEQAKKKHLFRFILLVLLATAFHQTAIVFFPIYFICRLKFSTKNLLIFAAGAALIAYFANTIIGIANQLFDRDYNTSVESGGYVATAIYFIILFVVLLYYYHRDMDVQTPLLYVLIVGTVCYILRYIGTLAAERISFYFAFSQIALLPKAVKIMAGKDKMIMYLLVSVLAVALFAYRLMGSDFVPYRFFWQ